MKTFESIIEEISGILTADQIQLLKDTINYGAWGDCDMAFKNPDGTVSDHYCFGYCTNDAKDAGHFSGRKVSAMFRSMYQRLGMLGKGYGCCEYFSYCNDWWGDGSGDMFFIRGKGIDGEDLIDKFEAWARA